MKAVILSMSRVLMAMSLGLIVCSEKLTPLMAIGATVLLASITLVIVRKSTTQGPLAPAAIEPLVDGKEKLQFAISFLVLPLLHYELKVF